MQRRKVKWWEKPSVVQEQIKYREKSVPDFELMEDAERNELRLISEEMAYVLLYRVVQDLEPIEKLVIRYQFGLPKTFTRGAYYPQRNRLALAKELQEHEYFKGKEISTIRKQIKHIREDALKKLFSLMFSDKYQGEIRDINAK